MRTSLGAALTLILLVGAAPLRAQDALNRVTPATEVRSVEFRFEGTRSLNEDVLRQKIALTGQGGFAGLRRTFGFLPFVPPVGAHQFDPVEMQRDVVRLRNYYHRQGFPKVEARYDARFQAKPNAIRVAYVIAEGPPILIDTLGFTGEHGPIELPSSLDPSWRRFVRRTQRQAGRAGEDERRALADSTARWFRAHGYPFASAKVIATVDSAAFRASVEVQADPGQRARIRRIVVTGNETIPAREIVRQLPIQAGDWYDSHALEEGRQRLTEMDIIRLVSVDVPRDSAADSSVVVRLGVSENPEHIIKGEAGFISSSGVTTQASWTDRSWLRGLQHAHGRRDGAVGRRGAGEPGAAALPAQPHRVSALRRRPPALGGGRPVRRIPGRPSRPELGGGVRGNAGVRPGTAPVPDSGLFDLPPACVRLRLRQQPRGRAVPAAASPRPPGGANTLQQIHNSSVLALEGSYGRLDRIASPRKGYVIRPRVAWTPPGFNTSEYFLVDLGATTYVPLSKRVGFTFRAGGGRLFPYGNSIVAGDVSGFVSLLRLRDVTFTAGGTRDVRGWGTLLLGPKLPEVQLQTSGDSTVAVSSRYTPVGGLARLIGSAELHFPMPVLSDAFQPYVFYDVGRVWTPDSRFALNAGDLDEDRYYQSIGIGIGYETVVGAIQVALGYKLNPSPIDLRSPQDVLDALENGTPIGAAPTSNARRFHLHFSIGTSF